MTIVLRIAAIAVVFSGFFIQVSQGRLKRCYICRSRGELGDCKDPFEYNATNVDGVKGVEALPCASGWCAKVIEGENSDFDTATERMCVQRPPTDNEERCSDTIIDRKPVYMCFCQGDLCNGSQRLHSINCFAMITIILFILLFNNW